MAEKNQEKPIVEPKNQSNYGWKRWFSIANQLRFCLALLGALSVIPTGGMLIYISAQSQLQQLQLLQQERSQRVAHQINNDLDDLYLKLSYLARVRGLSTFSAPTRQSLLEGLSRHNKAYEMIAILNPQGEVVAGFSQSQALALDLKTNSIAFTQAFQQEKDYFSPVRIDVKVLQPYLIIAIPIRNQEEVVDGILISKINLNFLWSTVSQIQVGKTGYIYIVDERNYVIAEKGTQPSTFNLKNLSKTALIQEIIQERDQQPFKTHIYQGLNGDYVLGATSQISNLGWDVVVETPVIEAIAPLKQMLWVMGVGFTLITIIGIGFGFTRARQIVQPLQELTLAAAQITKGNFKIKVNLNSPNELGVLAETFNQMSDQIQELFDTLEQERNFVTTVLDVAGALVLVLDCQGRIIRFNRACEQTTLYSFYEVKGQYFWDILLPPDEISKTKRYLNSLLIYSSAITDRTETFQRQFEGYLRSKNGDLRLISWSETTLFNQDNKLEYIISTGIDITEKRRAEKELQESESRLKAIINNSPTAIFLKDLNGQYLLVNKVFQQCLNLETSQIIGKTDDNFLPLERAKAIREHERIVIQSKKPLQIEEEVNLGTELKTYFSIKFILYDALGKAYALCGISTDITDRKLAEEALRKAKEEAEVALENFQQAQSQLIQNEKMSSLGHLVAGIAHEINNPINFIYGNLAYIEEYTQSLMNLIELYQKHLPQPDDELLDLIDEIDLPFLLTDLPKVVNSMKIGTQRIREIVLSLRNFSRLDEAEMKAVDIHEGIDSTLLILQHRLKDKTNHSQIQVIKQYGEIPKVECYAGQLNQVFMNVLSNAIDALEESHCISSSEDWEKNPAQVKIYTTQISANTILISIADNGPGMTEAVKAKLFDPFFTTKPIGKGTGLGLSISYQIIVEKHKGKIECVSEIGVGTEFKITIPLQQNVSSKAEDRGQRKAR